MPEINHAFFRLSLPVIRLVVLIEIFVLAGCGNGDESGGGNVPVVPTILKSKVAGMAASGLVLQNESNGEALAIDGDGVYSFSRPLYPNDVYNVIVIAEPVGQTCSVNNGAGVLVINAVAPIASVICNAQSYTVGGSVTGLLPGRKVRLLNNGADVSLLTGRANANPVTYSFENPVAVDSTYTVAVVANPPDEVCTVATAGGYTGISFDDSNLTNVNFMCGSTANARTIGGSVAGLTAGNQIVLQNNGNDNRIIAGNGPFLFDIKVADQSSYDVRLLTGSANQVCTVEHGVGQGQAVQRDVSNVNVVCNNEGFTIGGVVSGLKAGSSVELLLGDNKQESLTVTSNTVFTFNTWVAAGAGYSVNVGTQPTGQICTPTNNTGKANPPINNVTVTCSDRFFTVSGKVTGWNGSKMVLKNTKTNSYATVTPEGTFVFPAVVYSTPYEVIVDTYPVLQDCAVTGETGTVTHDVNSVEVACKTAPVTVLGSLNKKGNAGYPVGLMQAQDGDLYGITTTTHVEFYRSDRHYKTGSIFKMTPGQTMETLYTFQGSNPNGARTYDPSFPTGLMQGHDKNIYITTYLGGPGPDLSQAFPAPSTNVGEIYQLIPSFVPTVSSVYPFPCGANPILFPCTVNVAPVAELIQDTEGNFYGVAYGYAYRRFKAHGGMVYKLTASGEFTLLHDFTLAAGAKDGLHVNGKLTLINGYLYGTTEKGGLFGRGTIFKVSLTGSDFGAMYHFPDAVFPEHPGIGVPNSAYPDGIYSDPYSNPYSGLTPGKDGNLYGVAKYGGDNGAGWIFKLTLTDPVKVEQLYSFAKDNNPTAELIQLGDGNFYGTTEGNYDPVTRTGAMGSIFKFAPNGVLTTLYEFAGITANGDGNTPSTRLVGNDGNLYGATRYGGYFNEGTIYKIGRK